MQRIKKYSRSFEPYEVLRGSINDIQSKERRLPEKSKIHLVENNSTQKFWIGKDLKHKIPKWEIDKVFIPHQRSIDF
jgi:hypothetical protein